MPDVVVAVIASAAVLAGLAALAWIFRPSRKEIYVPIDDWPTGSPDFDMSEEEILSVLAKTHDHYPKGETDA